MTMTGGDNLEASLPFYCWYPFPYLTLPDAALYLCLSLPVCTLFCFALHAALHFDCSTTKDG